MILIKVVVCFLHPVAFPKEKSFSSKNLFKWAQTHPLLPSWVQVASRGFPAGGSSREPKRCRFEPWVGKIPWRREWLPLQYSCLENPLDRGAWWATVHGVAERNLAGCSSWGHTTEWLRAQLPPFTFERLLFPTCLLVSSMSSLRSLLFPSSHLESGGGLSPQGQDASSLAAEQCFPQARMALCVRLVVSNVLATTL